METLLLNIFSIYYLFCLIWLIGAASIFSNSEDSILKMVCKYLLILIFLPFIFVYYLGSTMANIREITNDTKFIKNKSNKLK